MFYLPYNIPSQVVRLVLMGCNKFQNSASEVMVAIPVYMRKLLVPLLYSQLIFDAKKH